MRYDRIVGMNSAYTIDVYHIYTCETSSGIDQLPDYFAIPSQVHDSSVQHWPMLLMSLANGICPSLDSLPILGALQLRKWTFRTGTMQNTAKGNLAATHMTRVFNIGICFS